MARPRSDTLPKEAHSVSLKVLRLSRPLLAQAHPLPYNNNSTPSSGDFSIPIAPSASLAYPYSRDRSFVLSPNLALPSSFGSAHVGETFSCSLCANNELRPTATGQPSPSRVAGNISIVAEIQSPSTPSFPLQSYHNDNDSDNDNNPTSVPGSTLQRIIHFDLKEEGVHVLAVNATELPAAAATTTSSPVLNHRRYALEAQLENVSESTSIALTRADLLAQPPLVATGINDGRTVLGNLRIEWRGAMGARGGLTTGALLTKKPQQQQ
ncbi:hypothetical protein DV735_g505, partial [Chaetothyriales sp. CBS 134920]